MQKYFAKGQEKCQKLHNVDDKAKNNKLKEINDICLAIDNLFSLLLHRFASEPDAVKRILNGMIMLEKNNKIKRIRNIFVVLAGGIENISELVPNITIKKLQEIFDLKTDKIAIMDKIVKLCIQQPSKTDTCKNIHVY